MSDLDKWWVWCEAASDTAQPAETIAQMWCVMQGKDIVKMYRDRKGGYVSEQNSLDLDVLNYHIILHWAREFPLLEGVALPWGRKNE
jgi:hypothetical protein